MKLITISQHDHTSTGVVHTWTWTQNIQARSSSFKETFKTKTHFFCRSSSIFISQ